MGEIGLIPTELTEAELALQAEVRAFLASEIPPGSYIPGLGMGAGHSRDFSLKLGARGWLGMALPKRYGGGDRTAVDRLVVTEELLRSGAPVAFHWVADRQSGPVLARFGTEEQRQRFLPGICRGEIGFAIGMSEPDAGSDLAGVATRAERVPGGWSITGTKVWTTGAHFKDWMVTLCRTGDVEGDRHAGLSQLIVDLHGPGVEIRPIPFLDGTAEFNEVSLSEAFVPDELVLGEIGKGWSQNTSELAFERGGADRWLSTYIVVEQFLREQRPDDRAARMLGEATSMWWAIRRLTLALARMVDEGRSPVIEAALIKELGTRFEQDVLEALRAVVEMEPTAAAESLFERLFVTATLTAPSFTIRGGTIEILRSVAAKGLRP